MKFGVLLAMLAGIAVSTPVRAQPSEARSIVENATREVCVGASEDPKVQSAMNTLRVSTMQLCECTVTETSYGISSGHLPYLAGYMSRLINGGTKEYANMEEKSAWDYWWAKYSASRSNCLHRITGR